MRKLISAFLALALLLCLLPAGMTVPAQAAGPTYGSVPILCGDPETDLMTERILSKMNFKGLSDRDKLLKIYDWVIANCTRVWDMSVVPWMEGPTPQEVAAYSEQMFKRIESGQAFVRADLCKIYTNYTAGESAFSIREDWIDSTRSLQTHGYSMVHTYAGDCVAFSEMFALLAGHLGYDVRVVTGAFLNKTGPVAHTWNMVLVGNKYYWFDVRIDDGNTTENYKPHNYFMKEDTDEWAKKHEWARGYTDLLMKNVKAIKAFYESGNPHTHEWVVRLAESTATCEQVGYRIEFCRTCRLRRVRYLALGHNWKLKSTSQPTCTKEGKQTFQCTRCSEKNVVKTPALGHEWKVDKILAPAEDGAHGTAHYLCGVCGADKTANLCASELYTDAPKPKNWAHSGVDFCVFRGLMIGTSATKFSPEATLTRAMVAQILWAAEGWPAPTQASSFRDVKRSAWYANAVAWAEETGLASGVGDGRFAPNQAITRQELAVMLRAYAAYQGYSTEEEADLSTFPDGKDVSKWARPAMRWAVGIGILSGTTGPNHEVILAPKQSVTRAMAAVMFMRLLTTLESGQNQ